MGSERPASAGSARRWRSEIGVVLLAAVLLLTGLSWTDLWAPDEPRYAQIAEEVRSAEHGAESWVLLRLNGAPYSQKPPLYYWLAAAIGSPAGRVSEAAARLPSALAGVALVWLTLRLGLRLFPGGAGALWGAALLLATFRFGHLARRVQLDVLLAAFEAAALLLFWRLDRGIGSPRWNVAGLHLALGLAVLTKGPVGLLPLAVMAAFLAWEGRTRELRRIGPAWAWLLSLGPGLVWISSALALAPEGFFGEAIVENVFARFFSGSSHARPFYYFFYQLPLDSLPVTLLWPLGFWAFRRAQRSGDVEALRSQRLLLAWVSVFFVFFSLSTGKRGLYLLPIAPALALLCGHGLAAWLDALAPALATRWRRFGFALAAGLAIAGAALFVQAPVEVASGFAVPAALGAILGGVGVAAAAALVAGLPGAPVALAAVWAVEATVFLVAYPALDEGKSPRPIAVAASRAAAPGEPVAIFDHRSAVGGIAYYGSRRVVEIRDEDALRRYWSEGGRVVIARTTRLDRVRRVAEVEVRARLRAGRRETLVLTPASPRIGDIPVSSPTAAPGSL